MKQFQTLLTASLLSGAVLMVGCASVPMASPKEDAVAKTFQPVADKAKIYIYRPNAFVAAGLTTFLLIDGKPLGQTGPGTYHMVEVIPGSHTIETFTDASSPRMFNLNTQAGKIYYVWQNVGLTGDSRLQVVNEDEGKEAVANCDLGKRKT